MVQIRALKNLGPASEQMLHDAGIMTVDELRQLGAVAAYLRVKATRPTSLNLLYAIYGALNDCHWTAIPYQDKQDLLLAIDAAADVEKHFGLYD